jgi:hypothetical protein
LQVSLTAGQSFDPESDPLTYEMALYADSELTHKIDSAAGLEAVGVGENVVWPVATILVSGHRYFWSCRAFDGQNHSDWAPSHTFWAFDFSVNADETPPDNLFPVDGQVVTKTRPELQVGNVITVLEENIYYFEVSEDSLFTNRLYSGPVPEGHSGRTTWEVSAPLNSGEVYYWRSRANNSPYSEVSSFAVDAAIIMAPNPFQPSRGHRQVTIYNMALEGTLTITTVANEVVRVLQGNGASEVFWDVTNSDGKMLASDVYLCYYKDRDRVDKFKFVVIR